MLRKPLVRILCAVLLGIGFVVGLARLFALRYEVGDVYPAYSSLRADPLGTKALATALDELPNVEVSRNYKSLPRFRTENPVTLVYAGVPHQAYWTRAELVAFNTLVLNGSRAVFTFFPVETPHSTSEDKASQSEELHKKQDKADAAKEKAQKEKARKVKKGATPAKDEKSQDKKKKKKMTSDEDEEPAEMIDFSTVAKQWGFDFGYLPEEKGKAYYRHAALIEPGGHMESDISWHSALYFKDLKPQWKVLYMCGTMPVVIERQFGRGSIVLVSDSFPISNEALRSERHPRLLSRLFSGPPIVVFDEEHNNLREQPGIASLVRKYRLHGVIAGLVLLAVCFVWKNVIRFVPAYSESAEDRNVVAGKDSSEGFINLLRRSIKTNAIMGVCMGEWRKSFRGRPREMKLAEEIWAQEQSRSALQRNPVRAYRAISHAVTRKT